MNETKWQILLSMQNRKQIVKKIFNSLLLIFLINIIYKGFLKIKHENLRLYKKRLKLSFLNKKSSVN